MPGFLILMSSFAALSAGWRSAADGGETLQGTESPGAGGAGAGAGAGAGGVAGRLGCTGRCRCEVDGHLYRVDCSDLGLLEAPRNLSVFTSYLDLSMNHLTVLTSGGLSRLHFLEELRLAGNDLTWIKRGAFSGLHNLRVLMLQNNQLRSVPAEAFKDLHNLQSLRLDANHISSVPVGCFSALGFLRHLWLDDNALTEVPVAPLQDLPALQAVTLALNHITHVPDGAFRKLRHLVVLHLNNNRIVSMGTNCFHGLHSLETLDLNFNRLVEFPAALGSLGLLKELSFHNNNIKSIPEHAFSGNPSLTTVHFYDNPIASVGTSAFQNLPELRSLSLNGAADLTQFPDLTGTKSLESLTITGTQISSLPPTVCENLPKLQVLDLSSNQIQTLPSFSGCENIQKIDLHHNQVVALQENTFYGLKSLTSVDLSWNRLQWVWPNSLSSLPALTRLDLSSNQLTSLPVNGLQTVTHLRLAGNDQLTELIDPEHLPRVRVMELPNAFQCCAFISCQGGGGRRGGGGGGLVWEREDFAGRDSTEVSSPVDQNWDKVLVEFHEEPKPQHPVHCTPAPGPFRPCDHLFGSWLVRVGVWVIVAVSLVSNCLVVLSIFFSPTGLVTPPRLLIGLLAVVNSLMGVWCGWLAAVDAWTFGNFWRYGSRWESSVLCRLSGSLFVFASQTSLFLLTVAVLERYLTSNSRHRDTRHDTRHDTCHDTRHEARHDTCHDTHHEARHDTRRDTCHDTHHDTRHDTCRENKGHSSSQIFIRLSVLLCFLLGLAVTVPPLVAGHGSTSLCLPLASSSPGLASSVFLVLVDSLCLLVMTTVYTRLYCSSHRAPPPEEEAALTRHIAWLLFADCLLLVPVAFLSSSSLLRLPVAGPEAAKAMLLLVAPLPACVNPLLFLLFNPVAREELAALVKCPGGGVVKLQRQGPTNDEDAEKQSCDSTQALVAHGRSKEEEEEEERQRILTKSLHLVRYSITEPPI